MKSFQVKVRVSFFAVLSILTSCSVGPDYSPPEIELPKQFTSSGTEQSKSNWWKEFKDPVLEELIIKAVENNKTIKQAAANIEQSRAVARLAKANLLPGVQLEGTYTRSRNSSFGFPGEGGESFDVELYSGSLRASWEIDLFGRLRRQLEADVASVERAEELLLDFQRLLIADVAEAYFQLVTASKRLEITNKSLNSQESSLNVVRTKFKYGESSQLEYAQAETRYYQTKALVPMFEEAQTIASNRIAYLTGEIPGKLSINFNSALPSIPTQVSMSSPTEMLRSRPDIAAAERQLASFTAKIGVAVGELYPKISISGLLGRDAENITPLSLSTEVFSVAPKITWAPFDTGRLRSVVTQTEFQAEEALYIWEDTVLTAFVEVEDALAGLDSYNTQVKQYHKALDAAEKALKVSSSQYKEGLIGYLSVLDSQRTALEVEDSLVLSKQSALLSLVKLYSALGYL